MNLNLFKTNRRIGFLFELLWREYFQWYALKYGYRLFHYRGIQTKKLLTSFYPERFKKWCNGTNTLSDC